MSDPIKIAHKPADVPRAIKTTATRTFQDAIKQQAYADLLYARDRIAADVLEHLRDESREPRKRQSM